MYNSLPKIVKFIAWSRVKLEKRMSNISLQAKTRELSGKGASRRLRRLDGRTPAIIYGGEAKPLNITVLQKELQKALENETFYASILDIKIDSKTEQVILKDLQRHPYKKIILHADFQRVTAKSTLTKMIQLHFINEDKAKGVKAGGIVNHNMSQVEVNCLAQDLPEFIEIDVANLELDEAIHLSELKLPKNVELSTDISDPTYDSSVVSIHIPKIQTTPQLEEEVETEVIEQKSDPKKEDSKKEDK